MLIVASLNQDVDKISKEGRKALVVGSFAYYHTKWIGQSNVFIAMKKSQKLCLWRHGCI